MIGLLTAPPTSTGRFSMASVNTARYNWAQCSYCGRAQANDCRRAQCLACGSYVCLGDSSNCPLCLIGIIPGWSGSNRPCGYKHCDQPAVAKADRIHSTCAGHVRRAKSNGRTVFEYISQHVHDATQAKPPYQLKWRQHVWRD